MLCSRVEVSQSEYLRAFRRQNVLDVGRSPREVVRSIPEGSTVVVLGQGVRQFLRDAVRLPRVLIHPVEFSGRTWRQIPHPSGLCRFYNDPVSREIVALLLEELYLSSTGR